MTKRYDYDSIYRRLEQRILSKLGGESSLLFSTNAAYISAVAEELDDFAMYAEFLTRENIWGTAKSDSFIIKQLEFFGYRPHRKIGATGIMRFSASKTFNGNWPFTIELPKWTQVSSKGLTFVTLKEDYLLGSPDCKYVDIPAVQGELVEFPTIITPTAYPKLNYAQVTILDEAIENTIYDVYVNNIRWKEIDHIRLAVNEPYPEKAEVYAVRALPNQKGLILVFGNNMFGKALNYTDEVKFVYLKTKGSAGNVLSTGVITSFDSKVVDTENNKVTLYCTNVTPFVGGSDYEKMSDIKAKAPKSFQITNHAISTTDYETFIEKLGYKGVLVWGEKEINEDNGNPPGTYVPALENVINITGFTLDSETSSAQILTDGDKTIIRNSLNTKKGVTDILRFEDCRIVLVTFKATAYYKDTRYTSNQIKELVSIALKDAYSITSRCARKEKLYKVNLYLSDYLRTIDAVEGVDHCVCGISLSSLTHFYRDLSKFSIDLNLKNIKKGSVSVKIKNDNLEMDWQTIARDVPEKDSAYGVLEGVPIDAELASDAENTLWQIKGAKINYQTGAIGDVLVAYGLPDSDYNNYQLRVDFELDDSTGGNLELTLRNQLFAWYANEITPVLMR